MPGASGALNALVKSIIAKTCLLHYGSDFLPFQEKIHTKVDTDAAWALKSEPLLDETDDSYSISDGEDDTLGTEVPELASASRSSVTPSQETFASVTSRERKQSLPLSGKVLIKPVPAPLAEIPVIPPKQLLKELMRQSQELQNYDCSDIAEEITRIEAKLFMAIEVRFTFPPRLWLMDVVLLYSQDIGCVMLLFRVARIQSQIPSPGSTQPRTISRPGKHCGVHTP